MTAVVEEEGLSQSGSGGDQPGVAAEIRFPFLQHVQLAGLEHRHGMRHGDQIVQQLTAGQTKSHRDFTAVHAPPHVRQLGLVVDDRTCDAEAGRVDRRPPGWLLVEEFFDHGNDAGVLL